MEKFVYDYISPKTLEAFRPYLPKGFEYTEDSSAFTIGVVLGDKSCGALCAERDLGQLSITNIFVDVAVRRQGVGTALVKAALETSKSLWQQSIDTIEFSFFMTAEEACPVNGFLETLGFKVYHDEGAYSFCYKFPASNIKNVPTIGRCFNDSFSPSPNIHRLSSVGEALIKDFIKENRIHSSLDYFQATDKPLDELSLCYMLDGKMQGYIVFEESTDGVVLCCAYTLKTAPVGTMLHLITTAVHYGVQKMGEACNCYINPINQISLGLINRISGGNFSKLKQYSAYAEL